MAEPQGERVVSSPRFRVGSRVRVKGHFGEGTRTIVARYRDIPGGVRLSAPVDGFVSWNVENLVPEELVRFLTS